MKPMTKTQFLALQGDNNVVTQDTANKVLYHAKWQRIVVAEPRYRGTPHNGGLVYLTGDPIGEIGWEHETVIYFKKQRIRFDEIFITAIIVTKRPTRVRLDMRDSVRRFEIDNPIQIYSEAVEKRLKIFAAEMRAKM